MIKWLTKKFVKNPEDVHSPEVRQGYGTMSGAVGIFLNLCLFAGKLVSGLLSGSIAITADALNNLSDAASSIVTLIGFRMAGRKPDLEHPFGHGRIEYIAGLIVSFIILMMGYELLTSSVGKILTPEGVTFSFLPAVILAASVLVKLWMAHFNHTLAKAIDSAAMEATAADSRSDAVATTAVLAGTDPVIMLTGPIPATQKALAKSGLSVDDIGVFEVNEAFATVPLAWQQEIGADWAKVNPNGGAIAMGHPLGGSGARLMTTMIHHMQANGIRYGLQTMCEGGGQANATILELL